MSNLGTIKDIDGVKLIYCFGGRSLDVLIPKKRGTGYLRQPVGHHTNELSKFVSNELHCDCVGLDGYLSLEVGRIPPGEWEKAKEDYIKPLAEFLGVKEVVEVGHHVFMDYVIAKQV
jgi:hypothetical protein